MTFGELRRVKFDKITLVTNKGEKVIRIDCSISNTAAWEFGAAFVKEEGTKTVDSSWEKDWDIIPSILGKTIMRFDLSIVEEWGFLRDKFV